VVVVTTLPEVVTTFPAAAGSDLGAIGGPNLIVLPRDRLTDANAGPWPKFRGMIRCPGVGFGSRAPSGVTMTPGLLRSVANAGRSEKKVSPFVSLPVMILKGLPAVATTNRLRLKPWRA